MAIRTSASDIMEILPDDSVLTDSAIEAFIEIASSMVDDLDSTLLNADRLKEIERFLTAHLISVTRDRQGLKEAIGEANITYTGYFGIGLKSTTYGQIVTQLDTTGALLALGRRTIKIVAITSFE